MTATTAAAEERCPRSDLYPSACWHCRGHTAAPVVVLDVEIERRWKARAPGTCGWCGEPYDEGEDVGRDEDGDRVCWRCLPAEAVRGDG